MKVVACDDHAGEAAIYGGGAPAVMVNIPRFLKHPSGHTVYEIDIDMPKTRQVRVECCFLRRALPYSYYYIVIL